MSFSDFLARFVTLCQSGCGGLSVVVAQKSLGTEIEQYLIEGQSKARGPQKREYINK